MKVGGVDGCRQGWVMVRNAEGKYAAGIYDTFEALMKENADLDRILIDIPIGLSSPGYKRTIEVLMREALKGRSSTVFNVPCRLAVYEENDEKARALNRDVEGKSLSIQSLNIRAKIKEVDRYLTEGKPKVELVESHPELCFKFLNGGKVVPSKKASPEGMRERLAILRRYDPQWVKFFEETFGQYKHLALKKDDVVDAICLCLVNTLGYGGKLSYLTDLNGVDEKGTRIRIGFFQ